MGGTLVIGPFGEGFLANLLRESDPPCRWADHSWKTSAA